MGSTNTLKVEVNNASHVEVITTSHPKTSNTISIFELELSTSLYHVVLDVHSSFYSCIITKFSNFSFVKEELIVVYNHIHLVYAVSASTDIVTSMDQHLIDASPLKLSPIPSLVHVVYRLSSISSQSPRRCLITTSHSWTTLHPPSIMSSIPMSVLSNMVQFPLPPISQGVSPLLSSYHQPVLQSVAFLGVSWRQWIGSDLLGGSRCCGTLSSTLPRVCFDILMSGLVVGGWVDGWPGRW